MSAKQLGKVNGPATIAILAALFCWTAGPIFIRYLTTYLDAWSQNFLRYSAAALFWLPFLFLDAKRSRLDSRIWRIALLPAVANVVMQSFWAWSFYYIEPAFMNLLVKSSIIWVAGFSIAFFADERGLVRSKCFWIGLILGVLGLVGVTVFKENFTARSTLTGIILSQAAGLTWAAYIITVRIAFKDTSSRRGFAVVSLYSVVGLGLLALLFGKCSDCLEMNFRPWACVVISGLVAIALGHVLFYASIKRIGAAIPSLVLLATPFTILIISRIIFGETLSVLQLISGLVLVTGGALAILAQGHLRRS